jgi:hypothetical protein
MKARIVEDVDDLVNPGDILPVTGRGGFPQLIIICPGCGQKSASAGNHKYDKETISYHPSIVHDTSLGGCGWHGWLTNGEFKQC